jgi:hypothetical protein
MKDFSNASFPPELIGIMKEALDASVATLPEPVSSAHVQSIAETILRTAKDGERDPKTLQMMPRDRGLLRVAGSRKVRLPLVE